MGSREFFPSLWPSPQRAEGKRRMTPSTTETGRQRGRFLLYLGALPARFAHGLAEAPGADHLLLATNGLLHAAALRFIRDVNRRAGME